jgi:hypothetical protein
MMQTERGIYRFRCDPEVPMAEVRESLQVAILAAEGLHGAARVRLDFAYCADDAQRALVLDARAEAGMAVARVFTGFLTQQFGETAFRVERVGPPQESAPVNADRSS